MANQADLILPPFLLPVVAEPAFVMAEVFLELRLVPWMDSTEQAAQPLSEIGDCVRERR